MDKYEFKSAIEAEQFAISHLRKRLPTGDFDLTEVVRGTHIVGEEPLSVPEGGAPMMIDRFRYVIRKDDLKLVDAILDGFKAAAPVGFFVPGSVTGMAEMAVGVGLLIAVIKICRDAIAHGKVLDPVTFAVLYEIKQNGPLLEGDLLSRLKKNSKMGWTDAIVREAIDTLKSLPMKGGLFRELVKEDSGGFLHAVGV